MTGKPRILPGSRRDRERQERYGKDVPMPFETMCDGLNAGEYVAGIDFYCDGAASSKKMRPHTREVVGRYRHSTCEKWQGFEAGRIWMEPLPGRNAVAEDGQRYRLPCPKCGVDVEVTPQRMEAVLAEIWEHHARRVERRNVSSLLIS